MCVCVCVGVWVCGCVGVWVCVCVCGCVGVWVCVCVCLCLHATDIEHSPETCYRGAYHSGLVVLDNEWVPWPGLGGGGDSFFLELKPEILEAVSPLLPELPTHRQPNTRNTKPLGLARHVRAKLQQALLSPMVATASPVRAAPTTASQSTIRWRT